MNINDCTPYSLVVAGHVPTILASLRALDLDYSWVSTCGTTNTPVIFVRSTEDKDGLRFNRSMKVAVIGKWSLNELQATTIN